MERSIGWKPMPVLLKVIWILLLISAVFSIMGIFTAPKEGFIFMGNTLYGLWAANTMFAVNILCPVVLLVAMIRRYRWAYIAGILLCLIMITNELLMLRQTNFSIEQIMSSLPEEYLDMLPDMFEIVRFSVFAGIVFGILVDVFFLISFVSKRKYFATPEGHGSAQDIE